MLTQDPFYQMKKKSPFQLLETLRWDPQAGYTLLGAHMVRLEQSAVVFQFPL